MLCRQFPSRRELVDNVMLVLTLYRQGRLHVEVARQVAKGAIWWASNQLGKDHASRYWTKAALRFRDANPQWERNNGFLNEHVIPRNLLEARLLALEPLCQIEVGSIIDLSFTCLIRKDEDGSKLGKRLASNMPDGWQWGDDPFARYIAAGLTWYEVGHPPWSPTV